MPSGAASAVGRSGGKNKTREIREARWMSPCDRYTRGVALKNETDPAVYFWLQEGSVEYLPMFYSSRRQAKTTQCFKEMVRL